MSILLNVLLSLAFAGAVGGAVHYWRVQLDTARRDALQALAARRGWALTVTGERLGRAGTLRIAPRGGHPWTIEVRPKAGPLLAPVTEYESAEPRWPEGTLILVAAPTDMALEPAGEEPEDATATRRTRALRDLLGPDLASVAAKLPIRETPEGAIAFADEGSGRRVDLQDLVRALQRWTPAPSGTGWESTGWASGPRGGPVLILSPEGMRLRLRHPLQRADRMERFADLALDLARLIGP